VFIFQAVLPGIVYYQIVGGATIVPDSTSWAQVDNISTICYLFNLLFQALICEIVLTYILVNTVLVSAVDRSDNLLAPLAIGLSITLDIFAGYGSQLFSLSQLISHILQRQCEWCIDESRALTWSMRNGVDIRR